MEIHELTRVVRQEQEELESQIQRGLDGSWRRAQQVLLAVRSCIGILQALELTIIDDLISRTMLR